MFQQNISLSLYSNYKIGGSARYFFQSDNLKKIIKAVETARREKLPIFILGGGTNLLFSDEGFSGLMIKPVITSLKISGNLITVGSGFSMENLLEVVSQESLAGLEWAGGLPGLVGGAIRGNAGAFKGEIKDNLVEAVSLDISGKYSKIIKRNNEQCRFGYRDSVFKSGSNAGKEIILEATFSLRPGNKKSIQQAIEENIAWRQNRQPLEYPNIGSIFKNVDWQLVPKKIQALEEFSRHLKTDPFPVLPAATLIDRAGLKGVSFGGATISQKHPNFIVNTLGASSDDVKTLIKLVKAVVYKKFGIKLEEEIIFV